MSNSPSEPRHPVEHCDVMICYRRIDLDLACILKSELVSRFDLKVFLDKDCHTAGYEWRPKWQEQLDKEVEPLVAPGLGPVVVILATDEALASRLDDIVVTEIVEALNPREPVRDVPIILLRFGRAGWEELERRLLSRTDGSGTGKDAAVIATQLHQPPVFDCLPAAEDDAPGRNKVIEHALGIACTAIVKSVRSYFIRRLSRERHDTQQWAKRILARRLFGDVFYRSDRTESSVFSLAEKPEKRAVVVVGPGGTGKTTEVARVLLMALAAPYGTNFFPLVFSASDLQDLDGALRKRLGLSWVSIDQEISLAAEGLQWFQNSICIVTDSLEHADQPKEIARKLQGLSAVCKLLITSRPQAWGDAQPMMSIDEDAVCRTTDLSDSVITAFGLTPAELQDRPFLRNPVFLDIQLFLREPNKGHPAAVTETGLLDQLRTFCLGVHTELTDVSRRLSQDENEAFVRALATVQMEKGAFAVKKELLCNHQDALHRLTAEGRYLVMDGPMVRLRHDVLDSHNIATALGIWRDEEALRSALRHLDKGFGQLIFEGVVQFAHDSDHSPAANAVLDLYFAHFLFLLDHKKTRSSEAWNAGYVVSAKLSVFLARIQTLLSGKYLGDLEPQAGDRLSLFSPPQFTQLALSSVASMFGGADTLSIDDGVSAIFDAFRDSIPRVLLRARLIEALPKFRRQDDVMTALEAFARDEALLQSDPALMRYISAALVDLARADKTLVPRAHATLQAMAGPAMALRPPSLVLRRAIVRAIGDLPYDRGVKPANSPPDRPNDPYSIEEIEEGLQIFDRFAPKRAADWTIVENYLAVVRRERGRLQSEHRVVIAVAKTLRHQHTRVHQKAIEALGDLDCPAARGALLDALAFQDDDVAVIALSQSLTKHFKRVASVGQTGIRFGIALLRALCVRGEAPRPLRPIEFGDQIFSRAIPTISTSDFVEIVRFDRLPELTPREPAAALPAWMTDAERNREVGEEREKKIGLFDVLPGEAGVAYLQSSWAEPRRLHLALAERLGSVSRLSSDNHQESDMILGPHLEAALWLYESYETHTAIPSIASVHTLLVTSDDQIVQARRAKGSAYHPGAWSLSFEEQVRLDDFQDRAVFMACLLRGLREEFSVDIDMDAVKPVAASLGIEWAIGNHALLVVCRLSESGASLRRIIDLEESELDGFDCLPIGELTAHLERDRHGSFRLLIDAPQHPTNAARLALLTETLGLRNIQMQELQ